MGIRRGSRQQSASLGKLTTRTMFGLVCLVCLVNRATGTMQGLARWVSGGEVASSRLVWVKLTTGTMLGLMGWMRSQRFCTTVLYIHTS